MKAISITLFIFAAIKLIFSQDFNPAPTTLNDFTLPGSQPGQSGNIEHPSKCDNCHGGYDVAVEPAFNWRGSMMSQAARDPLFYACMAIANQDAPESGDLCIRCHSPSGWLEGRSVPTDGSALNNNDREGVQCDFCHKLVNPKALANQYSGDTFYELNTWPQDQSYLLSLTIGPPVTSANGMYVADANNAKRGPYTDAAARHQMFYSPFHRESAICGTCHDVSNPVYVDNGGGTYIPNAFDTPTPSDDPYTMFPVERTYSEWLMSDFAKPGGQSCQDCHMRDVTGYGCNKRGAPLRTDLPLHDMTGGNTFIPKLINAVFPGEADQAALDAGIARATAMLQSAAEVTITPNTNNDVFTVRVTNLTGHKLPSGYPEGRRIWINFKAFDLTGNVIFESGAYDFATAILSMSNDPKIYEIKPGMDETIIDLLKANDPPPNAGPSFHFVLNNHIYKDNRIPPKGFTNDNFNEIQSPVIAAEYADGQHWDETVYDLSGQDIARVEARLYYQTISKEYVEFLRDENRTNQWGQVFYDLWAANGKSEPVVMNYEFYDISAIPDNEPPTIPANLTATAVSRSQIDLAWSASSDNVAVTGYNIFRDGLPLITVASDLTAFSDTKLTSGTTYSYQISAFDASANVSELSAAASATTLSKGGKPGRNALTVSGANPFNPTTSFLISLQNNTSIKLEIYNTAGQLVKTLINSTLTTGDHKIIWDAGNQPSGTYFARMIVGNEVFMKKVILLK